MKWLALLLMLVACGNGKSPEPYYSTSMLPDNATRIEPPPIWETWWAETEDCLGLSYPYENIEWYSVEAGHGWMGQAYICPLGYCFGEATHLDDDRGTIYISEGRLDARNTITHEAMHVLTKGKMGHSNPAFCYCTLSFPDRMTQEQKDDLCGEPVGEP